MAAELIVVGVAKLTVIQWAAVGPSSAEAQVVAVPPAGSMTPSWMTLAEQPP